MAKKVIDREGSRTPGKSGRRLGRGWLALVLVIAIALGGGLAIVRHRGQPSQASGVAGPLPDMPDLVGRPAELRTRLMDSQARALAERGAAPAVEELGRLYHANGFTKEAEACWQLLRAAQPQEGHWPYYLSDLCRTTSDEEGLRRWLSKTVELAPDYAPAWLELAELDFKGGRLDSAERAYRQRLNLVPHDPYAMFGLARIALQRGQHGEGKRQIEDLVREVPDFPSAHNVYAEILAQENDAQGAANQRWLGTVAGRFRAADDPWMEALRASCFDAEQLIVWGEIEYQTKHGDLGKEFLERAVRAAPENPRTYEKLGRFYLDTGDAANARDVLEHGRQLPGASEPIYLNLVKAYKNLNQFPEALRTAEQGLLLMPDSANLYTARGIALAAAGQLEKAADAYRAAMARASGAPEPVANLGLVLLQLGRQDEARACFKQALEIQPRFPDALVALGQLELDAAHPQSAAQYIVPYFQQFPGLHTARQLMANLHVALALEAARSGNAEATERFCREGLASVPDSAELYGFLGTFLAHERRYPEALEAFENLRRLQPHDPRMVMSLAHLYLELGRPADARLLLTEAVQDARQRRDATAAARFDEVLARIPQ